MKRHINPYELRQLLRYEHESGKLFWKERTPEMIGPVKVDKSQVCLAFNRRSAGKEAFTAIRAGYRVGNIFSRTYAAHRVIWAIVHGEWPNDDIDHIDGNRSNNKIGNLRDVTRQVNLRNAGMSRSNSTGVTGVYRNTHTKKFSAKISVDNKSRHLGYFDTVKAASKARLDAEIALGFHKNHGRRECFTVAIKQQHDSERG